MKRLQTKFAPGELESLRAGESILLSGPVIACRDRAHRRIAEMIAGGMPLPFEPSATALFYAAPTPAPPGMVCGSVGPTTSLRMDPFTLPLLHAGARLFIGKGPRSPEIGKAMVEAGAVYLAAAGGTAALGGACVVSCRILDWSDLGTEALYEMILRDYPVFVALDTLGANLFKMAGSS